MTLFTTLIIRQFALKIYDIQKIKDLTFVAYLLSCANLYGGTHSDRNSVLYELLMSRRIEGFSGIGRKLIGTYEIYRLKRA